jgi:DNA-binding PadR family transcriptional regulator
MTDPRRSKSWWAILGILTIGPNAGYDIKKFTEEVLSHFWHESYGNLYTLLKRLQAEKLVTSRTVRQKGKPDRIVYAITVDGREAFRRWLEEPAEEEVVRSELLLKLFFGDQTDSANLRRQLESFRARQQQVLRSLEAAQQILEQREKSPQLRFWKWTLRRGMLLNRARMQWVDECLEEIEDRHPHRDENIGPARPNSGTGD